MDLTASEVMHRNVSVVDSEMTLPRLERAFLDHRVSGFPVVDDGRLVGIVSRSDIVRQLCVERSVAEMTSDFYRDEQGFHVVPMETFEQVADRVGERIEELRVKDVMIREIIHVSPEQPLRIVAQILVDKRIHRVPVTDEGRLVGIITALDLVQLIADGRL